jgi:hypothetical protein
MGGVRPKLLKEIELQLWQVVLFLAQSPDGHTLRTLKTAFEKIDALLGGDGDVADIDWFDGGTELLINLLLMISDHQNSPYRRR